MGNLLATFSLMRRLGVGNSIVVLRHRRRLRNGYYLRKLPVTQPSAITPFWDVKVKPATEHTKIVERADEICAGTFRRFDVEKIEEGAKPQWLKGVYAQRQALHFSQVAVNDVAGEDIKLTWDLSRFKWVTQLALAALHSAEPQKYLDRLHALTTDWLSQHAYQQGALWNCSQEVSVRGLHLMLTTELLATRPTACLLELLEQSYMRVLATLPYAKAQRNNHSFTEVLFLFYVARFLTKYGVTVEGAPTRKSVIQTITSLIQADGSCAMPSFNYHRVFCDMASLFAVLDGYLNVGVWGDGHVRIRVTRMLKFLESVIEPHSGKLPNIGHNDGSLHALQFTPPQDAVPSLLLMSAVFSVPVASRFEARSEDGWYFGYAPVFADTLLKTRFEDFGLMVVDKPAYRAYLNYPRNRFRPQQIDFLHLDVWVKGENILVDSGTYSYNPAEADDLDDGAAHNAPVLLDGPFIRKRSQFLYRYWPNAEVDLLEDGLIARVSNGAGVALVRRVRFMDAQIHLEDSVVGAKEWGVAFNFPGAMTADTFREGKWYCTPSVVLIPQDHSEQKISSPGYATWYQQKATSCRVLVTPIMGASTIATDITIG